MLLALILGGVVALALVGCLGWLSFCLIRFKEKARHFEEKYLEAVRKDPLQLDLELATTNQLLEEMRRRPAPQFILLLPQFEPMGINLNIEVHNLPPHIALGLMKMAHKLAARQQGQEVRRQSDEFFNEPEENT